MTTTKSSALSVASAGGSADGALPAPTTPLGAGRDSTFPK